MEVFAALFDTVAKEIITEYDKSVTTEDLCERGKFKRPTMEGKHNLDYRNLSIYKPWCSLDSKTEKMYNPEENLLKFEKAKHLRKKR